MPDIVNIALSEKTHAVANSMLDVFENLLDVARFAFAYAITEDLVTEFGRLPHKESKKSVWNVGSLDSDGYMETIVTTLFDNIDEPYKQIELLINLGLLEIGRIKDKRRSINISEFL